MPAVPPLSEPGADGPTGAPSNGAPNATIGATPAAEGRAAGSKARVSQITGEHVRQAAQAAATWLELQAASVDALNVFPVPDGDTGTNMSMTMRAAAEAGSAELADHAGAVTKAVARGGLMGARGNSGVILSQLLRGFAEAAEGKAVLTIADLADGFAWASNAGYRAVGKPVEGTILTVARRAAEEAGVAAGEVDTVAKLLERVLRVVDHAVAETTEQLEALRSAGVVDAGAQGLRLIVEAFWRTACGKPIEASGGPAPVASRALVAAQHADEGGLGFCTEFMLKGARETTEQIRAFMESVGDSVIVVGDGALTRVHLHALKPGAAIDYAVERGTISQVKIENMQLQHRDAGAGAAQGAASKIGVVAVVPGAGFRDLFRSMGAAALVEGGQTMNPSVQDILAAVGGVGYQELILLPNNGNILLAARHAAEQSPRTLRVVPTRSLPQGIAALLAFNYEADLDENVRLMEEAASRVASIEVTRAVRAAQLQEWHVERGQSLGLVDDRLVAVAENLVDVALGAVAKAEPERRELVSIYTGEGVSAERGEELAAAIRAAYPHLDVEVAAGGQPHYPYILALE